MIERELGDVERITAGATGVPGQRTFYLQAVADGRTYSLVVEKEQVQLLATSILEILANVDLETGGTFDESAMQLLEPIVPLWRVGRIAIRFDEALDRIVLEVDELFRDEFEGDADDDEDDDEEEGEEEDEAEGGGIEALLSEDRPLPLGDPFEGLEEDLRSDYEPERLTLRATREQMLAVSRQGSAVVSKGRPTCQFCGNPMDADGHVCPAMNGHGKH